jgi:3-oxoacyl-[acyl-carrier-protein] synthase-1
MNAMNVYLNECGIVCALGTGLEEVRANLFAGISGVRPSAACSPGRELPLGQVRGALPSVAHLPEAQRSRNNALALAALAQIRPAVEAAVARFGAGRVGVIVGTSTSGIAETEKALLHRAVHGELAPEFHYGQQEMGSPAAMLSDELGIAGPAYAHSSACSSSAKAMASAARLIRMGLCDAVVAGGVDSLCAFTVAGFSALESVSAARCNPMSANRNGINIGEGAALFLMTREPAAVQLAGWGESSDGHHMSAPDPQGTGARIAMTDALRRAGLQPADIDYVNMHGTATQQNDAMESKVIAGLFGCEVPASSTKPFTGHTLGAAAAIEAALCWLALQPENARGAMPPHLWDGAPDPALPALNLVPVGATLGRPLRHVLSASFAFGGSNAVLVLGRAAAPVPGDEAALPPVADVLPHSGPMVLLDRLVSVGSDDLCAEVTIRPDSMFCDGAAVGAWVGIEYMAQAIAAHAGWLARRRGDPVKVGFLLGSRKYEAGVPAFAVGSVLRVHAHRALQGDNGLGAFECRIDADDRTVATATVTVFQPDNVNEFLSGGTAA